MTSEPLVVKREDSIMHVLNLMFETRTSRFPVVNDNNELIGLVLQQYILKKLLAYLKEE